MKEKTKKVLFNSLTGLIAVVASSCASVDIKVDKSKLKIETEEYAIYPSSAVTPVINAEAVNARLNEGVDRAIEVLAQK